MVPLSILIAYRDTNFKFLTHPPKLQKLSMQTGWRRVTFSFPLPLLPLHLSFLLLLPLLCLIICAYGLSNNFSCIVYFCVCSFFCVCSPTGIFFVCVCVPFRRHSYIYVYEYIIIMNMIYYVYIICFIICVCCLTFAWGDVYLMISISCDYFLCKCLLGSSERSQQCFHLALGDASGQGGQFHFLLLHFVSFPPLALGEDASIRRRAM